MFNLQGSEIVVILILALVILGPEKLPNAIRQFTKTYAEFKKMGTGFQSELKSALDEPMREMRETANIVRNAADPNKILAEAEAEERIAHAAVMEKASPIPTPTVAPTPWAESAVPPTRDELPPLSTVAPQRRSSSPLPPPPPPAMSAPPTPAGLPGPGSTSIPAPAPEPSSPTPPPPPSPPPAFAAGFGHSNGTGS